MDLETLWFWVLCFFWVGYFVLEGFDFGVGALLPVLGRSEGDKDDMFETIGPVWDGNEVWLVVAAGATLATFPVWYATMFSALYLALVLILLLLILRVVSFEWRGRTESARWRAIWTWLNTLGSVGAPIIWGIAFANLLQGLPINSSQEFTGDFGDLFSGYTVFAGFALLGLCVFHGAVYLTLRTKGDLCERALGAARRAGPIAALLAVAFLVWSLAVAGDTNDQDAFPGVLAVGAAVLAVAIAAVAAHAGRQRVAFFATAASVALTFVTLFVLLNPRVMVSAPDFANSLTIDNASSADYTLKVTTIACAVLLPVVILYQAWTYRVFRARVGGEDLSVSPADLITPRKGPQPTDGEA